MRWKLGLEQEDLAGVKVGTGTGTQAGGQTPLFLLFSVTVAALGKWQLRTPLRGPSCFLLPLEVLGQ